MKNLVIALLTIFAAGAAADARAQVFVIVPPPPPRVCKIKFWTPAHWAWSPVLGRYVWVLGAWHSRLSPCVRVGSADKDTSDALASLEAVNADANVNDGSAEFHAKDVLDDVLAPAPGSQTPAPRAYGAAG